MGGGMNLDAWGTGTLQDFKSLLNHFEAVGDHDSRIIRQRVGLVVEERFATIRSRRPNAPRNRQPSAIYPGCSECGASCTVKEVNICRSTHLEGEEHLRSVITCPSCHAEEYSVKYYNELVIR